MRDNFAFSRLRVRIKEKVQFQEKTMAPFRKSCLRPIHARLYSCARARFGVVPAVRQPIGKSGAAQ